MKLIINVPQRLKPVNKIYCHSTCRARGLDVAIFALELESMPRLHSELDCKSEHRDRTGYVCLSRTFHTYGNAAINAN